MCRDASLHGIAFCDELTNRLDVHVDVPVSRILARESLTGVQIEEVEERREREPLGPTEA